jgi:predicted N-acetyltransferase YhbS
LDRAIDETIATYTELQTPFRWHVGPSSRPADLAQRLLARGFEHSDTLAGMCIATDAEVVAVDPSVVVSELTEDDEEAFANVIASTFDHPDPVRERLLRRLRETRGAERPKHFVARLDGRVVGSTSYAPMKRAGFLQGAAVLEEYRGRGIYKQMIRERLERLRGAGCELAVITARTSTSAPICARLGFDRVCSIEVYRHPAGTTD